MNYGSVDEREKRLMKIFEIELSTSKSRSLDHLLLNDMALFIDSEVTKTSSSDHNIMEATRTYCMEMKGENHGISREDASKLYG